MDSLGLGRRVTVVRMLVALVGAMRKEETRCWLQKEILLHSGSYNGHHDAQAIYLQRRSAFTALGIQKLRSGRTSVRNQEGRPSLLGSPESSDQSIVAGLLSPFLSFLASSLPCFLSGIDL